MKCHADYGETLNGTGKYLTTRAQRGGRPAAGVQRRRNVDRSDEGANSSGKWQARAASVRSQAVKACMKRYQSILKLNIGVGGEISLQARGIGERECVFLLRR